jgi:hypothetical protein
VLAAAQLTRCGCCGDRGIEIEAHGGDVPVDLVVEEVLFDAKPQSRQLHQLAD